MNAATRPLFDEPLMPAIVIDGMWRSLRAGVPWTGPVMGRHKEGGRHWHNLYVVPLFDSGELSALGIVYQPIGAQEIRAAEALYARLGRGQSPWTAGQRIASLLAGHGLQLGLGLLVLGATLTARLPLTAGLLILLALLLTGLQPAWRQRRLTRGILGSTGKSTAIPCWPRCTAATPTAAPCWLWP